VGELLIRRRGLGVTRYRLKDEKCLRCGRTTSVVASVGGTCMNRALTCLLVCAKMGGGGRLSGVNDALWL